MSDRFRIIGDSGTNWNDTQFWSAFSGGAGGASVPGSSDVARFDGNSGNCTLEINIIISGLKLESGYTSLFSYGTKTASVGAGNAVIDAGTYSMGTNTITFLAAYTQNGGTVTSTSGILISRGNFKVLGGTFAHNGHTFLIGSLSQTIDMQNDDIGNIQFSMAGAAALTVIGAINAIDINVSGIWGSLVSGTINFTGNMFGIGGSTSGGGLNGTVKAVGVNQSISSTSIIGIPGNLEVACSGTLTLSDEIRLGAGWKYTSGIVDFGTSIIDFRGVVDTHAVDFGPENSLFDVKMQHTGTRTLTGTIIVTGDLTVFNARTWNGGTIELRGNIDIGSSGWAGTTAIFINGTGTQLISTNSGSGRFTDALVTVDKASGLAKLDTNQDLTLDGVGQDMTITNGSFCTGENDVTIEDILTIDPSALFLKTPASTVVTGSTVGTITPADANCNPLISLVGNERGILRGVERGILHGV